MATVLPRVMIGNVPRQARKLRSPKNPFHVRHMPFTLNPIGVWPVLPGETLKSLLLQARCVSNTVKNPLIGAWMEFYFFYVKFSDLTDNADDVALKDMILTPGRAMTDIDKTTANETLRTKVVTTPGGAATQIDFVGKCLVSVMEAFFKDPDETFATGSVTNGVSTEYQTHMKPGSDWLHSAIEDTDYAALDVDVDIDGDATIMASEVQIAMAQWDLLKQGKLVDMTFEDYLRSQGVNTGLASLEEHKPELIRNIRKFDYPVNTVDPTDGDPSTAFSWAITETADKDRFFSEPGFIAGYSCFRPKIYMSEQQGLMVNFLNTVYDWLPNVFAADSHRGMKKFNGLTTNSPNESDGPLDGITDDYWVDVKDLFLHGEQFVNFTLGDADAGLVAIPEATLKRKYATAAEMGTLFDSASAIDAMKIDGLVTLNILGQQVDTTAPTSQE